MIAAYTAHDTAVSAWEKSATETSIMSFQNGHIPCPKIANSGQKSVVKKRRASNAPRQAMTRSVKT